MRWINSLSWTFVLIFPLTLGLAPFTPEPHVIEKLSMLLNGELVKAIDIFDLFLHGTPWVLLLLKITFTLFQQKAADDNTN